MMKNESEIIEELILNNYKGGLIYQNEHFYMVKVFFEDTDAGGIVYHANYLRFFERARSSLLNLLGINQQTLLDKQRLKFVVRDISLNIRGSFKLNDNICIRSRLKFAKNTCISLEQTASSITKNFLIQKVRIIGGFQIVLINNKSKIKKINTILSHNFFNEK